MFRIYYHLYRGPSWREVWARHRPVLDRFAASGLLERLVVCVCGTPEDLGISPARHLEVRQVSDTIRNVNEFHSYSSCIVTRRTLPRLSVLRLPAQ